MAKKFAKKKTAKAAKPAKRKPVSRPAKNAAKTKKVAKQAKPSASHAKPAERLAPTKAALFAAAAYGRKPGEKHEKNALFEEEWSDEWEDDDSDFNEEE